MNNLESKLNQENNDRVRKLTADKVNQKIDERAARKIREVLDAGPSAISQRLKELDQEWDIDRVLMLNFSVIVFLQLLKARKNKSWLIGPLIQTPFLFMHATLGWCPPSLWFRRLGFRTRHEIQIERDVLLEAQQYKDFLFQ